MIYHFRTLVLVQGGKLVKILPNNSKPISPGAKFDVTGNILFVKVKCPLASPKIELMTYNLAWYDFRPI